jgi:hypothetical protein
MMKTAIATRRISHAGAEYAKGDSISLPDDQFDAWAGAGIVRAAPKPTPTPIKARAKPAK